MSTYNGSRFLRQQIDSILAQKGVATDLLVRDDGSDDGTQDILDEYQKKLHLEWFQGENMKPARSFLHLLLMSHEADYYAFADQDDYWKKDKLLTAVQMLGNEMEKPALYFSQTELADAALRPLRVNEIHPLLTFGESLIYEFIPGCTMVMNRALRDLVNRYAPEYVPMHDVWIYSIAQAVGAHIVFDRTPHLLYRQHDSNTIGQGRGWWHEWKRRWRRLASHEHSRYRRACALLEGYAAWMNDENKQLLEDFVESKHHLGKRLMMCRDRRLRCGNITTQRLFWVNLLTNQY